MTDDLPVSGERLLREITWALDRHGCTITDRAADGWRITTGRGESVMLLIANFIPHLLRQASLSNQRKLIQVAIRQFDGDGGTGTAPRTR